MKSSCIYQHLFYLSIQKVVFKSSVQLDVKKAKVLSVQLSLCFLQSAALCPFCVCWHVVRNNLQLQCDVAPADSCCHSPISMFQFQPCKIFHILSSNWCLGEKKKNILENMLDPRRFLLAGFPPSLHNTAIVLLWNSLMRQWTSRLITFSAQKQKAEGAKR